MFMTYGNEASMNWDYSHAVLLIEVPDHMSRAGLIPTLEEVEGDIDV